MTQAGSHAYFSGAAKSPCRSHVVQNLRIYLMRDVITIMERMCMQAKIELSSMSQRLS